MDSLFKSKTNLKKPLKKQHKVNKMMMKKVKVMNKMRMKKSKKSIKQQQLKNNQLSCGEVICRSVTIDDSKSSNSNNTSIKQYISMISDEVNIPSKQTKRNVDVIELETKQCNRQFKHSS